MTDVRTVLRDRPMTGFQIAVVAVCIAVNMIDGFDVLAAAFVAPSLSEAWMISPKSLGLFLSSGPVGMALGALVLGRLSDVFGRRPLVMGCVALMGLGMLLSAAAQDLVQLTLLRILTGFGIGGALASTTTVVAEYSSDKRRGLMVSLLTGGYPVGSTLGGLAAIWLLREYDWRAVFVFGGVLSFLLLPFIWLWLPESLDYLVARGTPGALKQVNATLRRLRLAEVDALPPPDEKHEGAASGGVFGPALLRGTVLMCLAYFMVMLTFYYVLQWTPKALVGAGMSVEGGVSGGTLMNLGGILGSFGFGVATTWASPRRLTPIMVLSCFALLTAFGFAPARLEIILPLGFLTGVFIFGSMSALYSVVPLVYPARLRGTGTGMGIGIGRFGAILGPIVAGYLIDAGLSRGVYTLILGAPLVIAALAVARVPLWQERAR